MAVSLGDIIYRGASVWLRLVGNTTTTRKFLRQTGTGSVSAAPAWDQVADADLSTTDITTNNVSTSKHGFAPKLPNDATKYLDGTGAYTVPAGSGGTNALLDGANHTDTTNSGVTKGDLIVGNSTPAWDDLPVGTNGHVLTADSGETMGMKWAAPSGGDTIVRKTSDESVTGSTTLQNDDELLFAVDASSTYWFEIWLLMTSNTASDWKCDWTVPSGTTMFWGADIDQASTQWNEATSIGTNPKILRQESTVVTWGGQTGGVHGLRMSGIIITAGTSGTMQFRWAQNTSDGVNNTIKANSFIRYRKIS